MGFRRKGRSRPAPGRATARGWVIFPILALAAALPAGAGGAEGQSMLFENAVIWTGEAGRPWAEALWVEEGTIRAVGSAAGVRAEAPPGVPRVDLRGAFLCPGLVDAHAHVLGLGLTLERVDLVGARSLDETLGRVAEWAARQRAEESGAWIRGRGWDQNDWPEQSFPTAADLDQVCADIPVCLNRIDGHAIWVNGRALQLAGVTAATGDPEGGRIERDAAGNPTGVFVDAAERLVLDVIPPVDRETKARAMRRATALLARAGFTAIHDMGMTADELTLYRELAARGDLAVRIYGALGADEPELAELLGRGPDRVWQNGAFKLGMVKFYADGALGSRGAALLADYSDDPGNRGLLVTAPEELERGMRAALRAGFQCAVHAIGDRGNRLVLDTWEGIRAEGGPESIPPAAAPAALTRLGRVEAVRPPVRLEHAQIIAPDDLPRLGALGVVASMQPTHCTSDMPWAPARLGPDRLRGAYAWRTVVDAGAVFAAGSDFPIESHDPLLGLYAAVTRRPAGGGDGWSPAERLGREEALAAFTVAPAYVSGDLHELGTLAPGKRADLTVLDLNLITCDPELLPTARVLLTLRGGRATWRDPDLAWPFTEETR